jgi:flagellar hook protein FlgE
LIGRNVTPFYYNSFISNTYKLEEMNTLFDSWDARQDTPIPSTAYAYRSTLFVYDSLGTPHEITVYYAPTTKDNVWEFLVATNPNEDQRDFIRDENPMQWWYKEGTYTQKVSIDSGKLFTQTKRGVLAYGRLEFDNQGNVKRFYQTYRLDANTGALVQIVDQNGSPVALPDDKYNAIGANGYPLLVADFLGIDLPYDIYAPNDPNQGTARNDLQQIELNFGYFYKDSWRSESVRTTQYATSNATLFYDQNGFGPGALENITVDNEGRITGVYSNGRVIPLWMVALANFNAPERLQKVGGNLFRETTHSGPPVTGKPGTNGLGTISPNSIEQSNVDLGEQFVKMIIFQRGFQADSRIITVSDTMLEELINLKR